MPPPGRRAGAGRGRGPGIHPRRRRTAGGPLPARCAGALDNRRRRPSAGVIHGRRTAGRCEAARDRDHRRGRRAGRQRTPAPLRIVQPGLGRSGRAGGGLPRRDRPGLVLGWVAAPSTPPLAGHRPGSQRWRDRCRRGGRQAVLDRDRGWEPALVRGATASRYRHRAVAGRHAAGSLGRRRAGALGAQRRASAPELPGGGGSNPRPGVPRRSDPGRRGRAPDPPLGHPQRRPLGPPGWTPAACPGHGRRRGRTAVDRRKGPDPAQLGPRAFRPVPRADWPRRRYPRLLPAGRHRLHRQPRRHRTPLVAGGGDHRGDLVAGFLHHHGPDPDPRAWPGGGSQRRLADAAGRPPPARLGPAACPQGPSGLPGEARRARDQRRCGRSAADLG